MDGERGGGEHQGIIVTSPPVIPNCWKKICLLQSKITEKHRKPLEDETFGKSIESGFFKIRKLRQLYKYTITEPTKYYLPDK